jgi:hypothetical protein
MDYISCIKFDDSNELHKIFRQEDIPLYLKTLCFYPDSLSILQYLICNCDVDLNTKIQIEGDSTSFIDYMIMDYNHRPLEIIRDFYKKDLIINWVYIQCLDDTDTLKVVLSIIAKTPRDIVNLYLEGDFSSQIDIFKLAYLQAKYPDDFEEAIRCGDSLS